MFRFAASLLALLVISPAANAERIKILSGSATYFSATNNAEICLVFSRPLTPQDYFGFWGGTPLDTWPPLEGFMIRNDGGQYQLTHIDYLISLNTPIDILLPEVDNNLLEFTISNNLLDVVSKEYNWEAAIISDNDWAILQGKSAIDNPVVYASEPSSIVLAIIVVCGCLTVSCTIFKK